MSEHTSLKKCNACSPVTANSCCIFVHASESVHLLLCVVEACNSCHGNTCRLTSVTCAAGTDQALCSTGSHIFLWRPHHLPCPAGWARRFSRLQHCHCICHFCVLCAGWYASRDNNSLGCWGQADGTREGHCYKVLVLDFMLLLEHQVVMTCIPDSAMPALFGSCKHPRMVELL